MVSLVQVISSSRPFRSQVHLHWYSDTLGTEIVDRAYSGLARPRGRYPLGGYRPPAPPAPSAPGERADGRTVNQT